MFEFVKSNIGFFSEFKIYNSIVDYEYLFNVIQEEDAENIEDTVKYHLEKLTIYYYKFLVKELETLDTVSITIDSVKPIDDLPVKICLYVLKNLDLSLSFSNTAKVGITAIIPPKQCLIYDMYGEILQTNFTINCQIDDENDFKNHIYNMLFYTYILVKDFNYHPLLNYIHHKNDIDNLVEIKKSGIYLFGEKNECSICYEPTISNTSCGHSLCKKCFCKLENKKCPICRKNLAHEETVQLNLFLT